MRTENILMGIPVFIPDEFKDKIPPFTPYKNSIQVAAVCCGCVVWQGPAQQLHKVEHPEYPIICAICLAKEIDMEGQMPEFQSLTNKAEGD